MKLNRTAIALVGRVLECVLGLVFLAGAALKARDINLFIVQIAHYGVVRSVAGFNVQTLLVAAALGTLAAETALGTALLLGCRLRGLTCAAVLALLAVFTGLIAYAWFYHDLQDCGCFGPIEMSPGVSIAKNAILALLTAAAWVCHAWRVKPPFSWRRLAVLSAACAVLAAALVAYAGSTVEPLSDVERPFAQFVFEVDGISYDLGQGEYFVAMLSMTCEHCMASVQGINDLFYTDGFPPVIALCFEEYHGALDEFRQQTMPEFPFYSMGERVRLFYELAGDVPPRYWFVRDGVGIAHWDEDLPDPAEVLALLQ